MKKVTKKLSLGKVKLTILDNDQMNKVKGAGSAYCESEGCHISEDTSCPCPPSPGSIANSICTWCPE